MNPDTAKGLWILPTMGRASTLLPRFLAACRKTGVSTPGVLVVDEEDYTKNHTDYMKLDLPTVPSA